MKTENQHICLLLKHDHKLGLGNMITLFLGQLLLSTSFNGLVETNFFETSPNLVQLCNESAEYEDLEK